MGTITITSAGFGATPSTAPANWPTYVTYPGAVAPNGSRTATITDAEMLQLVTWAAASNFSLAANGIPSTPTIAQILVSWIGQFFNGTKAAIQNYFMVPAVLPTPINLV